MTASAVEDERRLEAAVAAVGARWAYRLGRSLLAEALPQRWLHSVGVSQRALGCRPVLGDSVGVLAAAALLHDVGYAPGLRVTGFHALDGARYLRDLGVDDKVVRLVAHHSHAEIEAEIRGLKRELDVFAKGDAVLTDALVYCDMTTDPVGRVTDVESRLDEIATREDGESEVREFVGRASGELRSATTRFEALLKSSVG
jgi:putative nucleotidyltransferase with HDIG domain